MAKKSTTIHNHVDNINVEFDYDKLAIALLKAKEEEEQEGRTETRSEPFWKVVCAILAHKNEPTGKMTPAVFAILVSWLFLATAVVFWIMSFVGVAGGIYWLFHTPWTTVIHVVSNVVVFALLVAIAILVSLFGLMIYAAAHEIEEEKDRNYITAVFSGVVSVAALIVALASFFRGVG